VITYSDRQRSLSVRSHSEGVNFFVTIPGLAGKWGLVLGREQVEHLQKALGRWLDLDTPHNPLWEGTDV
jgi:hypothetical protein